VEKEGGMAQVVRGVGRVRFRLEYGGLLELALALAFIAREVLHIFCLVCMCNLMFTLLGT
jgi:hypothetical protein